MSKTDIRNRRELLAEIERLKGLTSQHEKGIRESIDGIKDDLRPENLLMRALKNMTGIDINKNEFIRNGIAAGIGLVMQRFVFKKEEEFERKIYSWIDGFFDKVKYYANKFSSAGSIRSEKIENDRS